MRPTFFENLYKQMQKNDKIWLLVGDLGYGGADKIRNMFPERFVNFGASEQAGVAIACGLAMEGKIPFVYSITNFVLYRPFEFIRNYVHHEQANVKLVGSGRDFDYHTEGWSHHSPDAKPILDTMRGVTQLWPEDAIEIPSMVAKMVEDNKPYFISLKR